MNTVNISNKKDALRTLLGGAFLLLIINLSISISAFFSKILSVYILEDIYKSVYFFVFFLPVIISFEIIFLIRNRILFSKIKFRKIIIALVFLYLINAICIYIEGNVLSIYISESYNHEDILYSISISQYTKAIIHTNSFILVAFSIYKLWR